MNDRARTHAVEFSVNGREVTCASPGLTRLADMLRDELGLTGTKIGCNAGDCGACTVLLDGRQTCACLVPVGRLQGRSITTVEGLSADARFARLQTAFHRHLAAQCGICTPGMLMAAADLLGRTQRPTQRDVEDALGGVLCRCTGYQKIVEAVLACIGEVVLPAVPEAGHALGARLAKVDGEAKVKGTDRFGADGIPVDALWVKAIRSPHPRARFTLGDMDAFAREHPGLALVLTARDVPSNGYGIYPDVKDQPVLANGLARYRGEPIVALVGPRAVVEAIADDAVPIRYRLEPPVIGLDAAMAQDAAQVHESRADNLLLEGRLTDVTVLNEPAQIFQITRAYRRDELGMAERELHDMQTELQGLLQQKNRLAAVGLAVSKVSHDLRNMLTSAQIISDSLASVEDPRVQRFAPRLILSLDRAINFLNQTLKFGQARELPPQRARHDLHLMAREVLDNFTPLGESRIAFHNGVPKDFHVDADREQLLRILTNLVKNGVQALEARTDDEALPPRVKIEAERDGHAARIRVCDTGPGIPEEEIPRLFERFHRVKGTRGRTHEGTGIGLVITRRLAELMNGRVDFRSEPGRGSRFRVHLPAGTKVQWNGNGWNVLAGSLETLKARTREVLYPEADAGTKAVTGQVETKSQLPSIPVIEKYPSLKSSYETSRLLDKGFALDQAGHTEQALEEYKLAHGTLRVELHHALEAKMKERGADPDQLLTLSANADPMIVGMLARSGLFAELGYDAVTTRQILERAGVEAPSLYHHFGSKLGLYRAVLAAASEPFIDRFTRLASKSAVNPERDVRERLADLVTAIFVSSAENPEGLHIALFEAHRLGTRRYDVLTIWGRMRNVFQAVLEEGIETGQLHLARSSAEMAANLFIGGLTVYLQIYAPVRPRALTRRLRVLPGRRPRRPGCGRRRES